MKKIIFYTLILFVNISFSNTSEYNKNTLKARELIFDFKFNEAEQLLKKDNSPVSYYLQSYSYFLKNLLIGGKENYNLYENNFDKIIQNIEKIKEEDSLKNLLLSEIYLQSAILKLMNKDFISGSYQFIKSHKIFKESEEKYPQLAENKKLSGLYKIIAGITPDKGKKFLEIIGLSGDINSGYKELNEYLKVTQKKQNYLYLEAYTLNKLVYIFLKEDLGISSFKYNLLERYKTNSSVLFSNILQNYKFGENKKLVNNNKILKEKNILEIPIIYYFLGISTTIINEKTASEYIYKYIKTTKHRHFIKSSYWQLARISILKNSQENFIKFKELTIINGETFTEADKQAENEAKEKKSPNKNLLKARLFFDAHKYKEANDELNKIDIKTLQNEEYKAEYYYRLGRIEYERKNYNNAKKNFAIVLKNYTDLEKYYIPYSALNIAYIYQKEKNKEKAKQFLELTLKLNKSEYQNSIKHKAKTALKRLESK